MEEFIPTFEKNENNILIKIDEFEDKIKIINDLTKQYDSLKKEIKSEMVKIGKENNLEQVKWITPKNIQITCSIGKDAIVEEVTEKSFSLDTLIKEYPDIYEACCYERTYSKNVKAASNDRLVITLPKETSENE